MISCCIYSIMALHIILARMGMTLLLRKEREAIVRCLKNGEQERVRDL